MVTSAERGLTARRRRVVKMTRRFGVPVGSYVVWSDRPEELGEEDDLVALGQVPPRPRLRPNRWQSRHYADLAVMPTQRAVRVQIGLLKSA
jgi:hypothetical protein